MHEAEENESERESSESSESDDTPLAAHPAVRAQQMAKSSQQRNANKRPRQDREEPVLEQIHDVCAVYGKGDNGQAELWLGIKLQCRAANKVRLQFLDQLPDEEGKYVLLREWETLKEDLIAHTFKQVVFKVTYKAVRRGRSKGKKKVPLVTKSALDAQVLKELGDKCTAEDAEADG